MTQQDKVIAAIARLVLEVESRTSQDTNEYIDMRIQEDRAILNTYVRQVKAEEHGNSRQ